jgi:hypothetical protein
VAELEFYSEALGREIPFTVFRPLDEAAADGSVLFLLHGRGRNHQSLIDLERGASKAISYQLFRVQPGFGNLPGRLGQVGTFSIGRNRNRDLRFD